MARVVVDVMLKPEILDPQGRAVMGALARLGLTGVSSVRQGKRFEIEVDGEIDDDLTERLDDLAGSLLSNPVIEDYEIYEEVADESAADVGGCGCGECDCGDPAEADAGAGASAAASPSESRTAAASGDPA